MGKLDELKRGAGGNAAESMGARDLGGALHGGALHGGALHGGAPGGSARPDRARYQGVERLKGGEIPVDRLTRDPSQPREIFDEAALQELVESIESLGVLQPVRVRWDEELGSYVIVSGERRLRAARMAGLRSIPCVIQDGELTESQRLVEQLAENIIRADLQPVEQARAFRRLMDLNGWSARQLAREMHIADAGVVRALALLDLPESVREQVEAGKLAPSVAYEVGRLDDPGEQTALADRVVAENLTRDEAVAAVREKKPGPPGRSRKGFKRNDGTQVVVSGPAAAGGRESVISALKWALKQAYGIGLGGGQDQAA